MSRWDTGCLVVNALSSPPIPNYYPDGWGKNFPNTVEIANVCIGAARLDQPREWADFAELKATIDKIETDARTLEATSIEVRFQYFRKKEGIKLAYRLWRKETPSEYERRIALLEQYKIQQKEREVAAREEAEERDRQMYERLRDKFEKNPLDLTQIK